MPKMLAIFATACLLSVEVTCSVPATGEQLEWRGGSSINHGGPSGKSVQGVCGKMARIANSRWGKLLPPCPETTAAAHPSVERKVQPIVEIENDSGGLVAEYALRLYEMREAKQKVRFMGRRDSACTLFLALPTAQTCITEGAYFRFHAPTAPSASAAAAVGAYMVRKYPKWVRVWIVAQGGLSDRLPTMSYEYANKFMRSCI
jgi:hypothetical protein